MGNEWKLLVGSWIVDIVDRICVNCEHLKWCFLFTVAKYCAYY